MKKRAKKIYPPGTFLPTPKRILAIIQLCLAISLLLWYSAQPFMGEYFSIRSRSLIYEYVLGISTSAQVPNADNQSRFSELPPSVQENILTHYQEIQQYAGRSFWIKLGDGLRAVLVELPAFKLAWIFFTITISILLLLKVEGSMRAVWILPVIALFYGIDNRMYGKSISSADESLFPSESLIVHEYLSEPLKSGWKEQHEQLQQGWNDYLVKNWLLDENRLENEQQSRLKQVEQAEFNFTVARLELLEMEGKKGWFNNFHEKSSMAILALYFAWNLLFARRMNVGNCVIKS